MKYIVKFFEWLIFLALIIVLLAAASPILPTKNVISTYVVTSGSMEPTLHTGGVVFTVGIDPRSLKAGDIITFKEPTDPTKTIVHRIVKVNKLNSVTFRTMGDNNNAMDQWIVLSSQVLGKSVFSLPFIGYAVLWLKTPIGFAVGMGLPALFLILLQVKKIKEGINEEVERRTKEKFKKQYPTIFFLLLLLFSLCLVPAKNVFALYTTHATVNGINLVVMPSVTPTPGGSNTIVIHNSSTTNVTQSNNLSVTNNVSTTSSTGNNSVTNNVSSSSAVLTGDTQNTTSVSTHLSTNEVSVTSPTSSISAEITGNN